MITGCGLNWYILADHRKPCVYGTMLLLLLFFHSSIAKTRWIVGGTQQLKTKVNTFIDLQNLADRLIAIDRVHRIGQENTVHVKHFIVSLIFFWV